MLAKLFKSDSEGELSSDDDKHDDTEVDFKECAILAIYKWETYWEKSQMDRSLGVFEIKIRPNNGYHVIEH